MAAIDSDGLGRVEYDDAEVYWFESGIPAFEHLKQWLLVERPSFRPLTVLQSVEQPQLRFACLPVSALRSDYQVSLGKAERTLLQWESSEGAETPEFQLICLAIVTFREGRSATANLLAPVLLNPRSRRGAQVVQSGTDYSTEYELVMRAKEAHGGPGRCS
jgi:flagellar assembly factor FliW